MPISPEAVRMMSPAAIIAEVDSEVVKQIKAVMGENTPKDLCGNGSVSCASIILPGGQEVFRVAGAEETNITDTLNLLAPDGAIPQEERDKAAARLSGDRAGACLSPQNGDCAEVHVDLPEDSGQVTVFDSTPTNVRDLADAINSATPEGKQVVVSPKVNIGKTIQNFVYITLGSLVVFGYAGYRAFRYVFKKYSVENEGRDDKDDNHPGKDEKGEEGYDAGGAVHGVVLRR